MACNFGVQLLHRHPTSSIALAQYEEQETLDFDISPSPSPASPEITLQAPTRSGSPPLPLVAVSGSGKTLIARQVRLGLRNPMLHLLAQLTCADGSDSRPFCRSALVRRAYEPPLRGAPVLERSPK